ncbi:site-2 protease family protein [Anaeromicrobium sediminis]|uniref:Peptidase M50 domain-containing protein n=1 Tax=Anaeromicrobium sediminis TaxID=1478221 RepID=A0A267MNL3_9FIRM|nr:site-2 protease family protein [Anaeromicrobium sediminis]PAB60992.1 hypothetical protein CCE28_00745 [Anaeromicrobium sediminis]
MSFAFLAIALYMTIFVHELGHYFACKLFKVPVMEFSLGLGPQLLSTKYKDTRLTLKLLPLGGYVEPDNKIEQRLNLIKRYIILLSGVFLNFIFFIMAIGFIHKSGFWEGLKSIPSITLIVINVTKEFLVNITMSDIYSPQANAQQTMVTMSQNVHNLGFWRFVITLNIIIIVTNLLPIPILDGGKIIMITLERVLLKLGISAEMVAKILNPIYFISFILVISPMFINEIWNLGSEIGLSLSQSLAVYAIVISFFMVISKKIKSFSRKI